MGKHKIMTFSGEGEEGLHVTRVHLAFAVHHIACFLSTGGTEIARRHQSQKGLFTIEKGGPVCPSSRGRNGRPVPRTYRIGLPPRIRRSRRRIPDPEGKKVPDADLSPVKIPRLVRRKREGEKENKWPAGQDRQIEEKIINK